MATRKQVRKKIVELLTAATWPTGQTVSVYEGRKRSVATDGNVVQVGVHFAEAQLERLSKGAAGKVRQTADFAVEIIRPAIRVEDGTAPAAAALEDALDDLAEVVRTTIEDNDTLQGTVWLADVTALELDTDQETQDDAGALTVTIRTIFDHTRGS